MDTINPQILPSTRPRKEHHRTAIVGVWVLVVALIIAALYFVQMREKKTPTSPVVNQISAKEAQLQEISVRTTVTLSAEEAKIKEGQLKTIRR
jgi:hypothetical protein